MPKLKVTLSIGFPTATHEDVLDIDEDEWLDCETDEQKDELMVEYWTDWSNQKIDCGYEIIEDGE